MDVGAKDEAIVAQWLMLCMFARSALGRRASPEIDDLIVPYGATLARCARYAAPCARVRHPSSDE